jgi:hypothetical protein
MCYSTVKKNTMKYLVPGTSLFHCCKKELRIRIKTSTNQHYFYVNAHNGDEDAQVSLLTVLLCGGVVDSDNP